MGARRCRARWCGTPPQPQTIGNRPPTIEAQGSGRSSLQIPRATVSQEARLEQRGGISISTLHDQNSAAFVCFPMLKVLVLPFLRLSEKIGAAFERRPAEPP